MALAREAIFEAEMGDSKAARDDATKALSFSRGRGALVSAGLALVLTGEKREGEAIVQDLVRQYPTDTLINAIAVPSIRAASATNQGNPGKAIETPAVCHLLRIWNDPGCQAQLLAWVGLS